MSTPPPAVGLFARAVLRATLALYPARFREHFGEGIAETFADRYTDCARTGRVAVTHFLVRFAVDGTLHGLSERLRPSHRPRPATRTSSPHLSVEPSGPVLGRLLDVLRQDFRFAVRSLARRPAFTATAVVTLAVGIGGNVAIFSLVEGVLLSPLPYAEPGGLITVQVVASGPGGRPGAMSYPDIQDVAAQSAGIQTLVGVSTVSVAVTGLGEPFVVDMSRVTEGLLPTFLSAPALGRDIRADEFGADGPRVAVIGHALWQERFGGSADVLDRILTLDGNPYRIVGVAPRGFGFPTSAQIWIPRRLDVAACGRGCHSMTVVGRMAPGANLETVRSQVAAVGTALAGAYPETNADKRFVVRSLKETVVGAVEDGLWILLAAVGLVLFIACANVVNLLLARASARREETAVRSALGASRERLMAQGLVESAVLASAGGLVGVLVAFLGVRVLRRVAATTVPRVEHIAVDGPVLAATAGCIVLATLVFGLAPAAGDRKIAEGLTSSGRGSTDRATHRVRSALLIGEVALSVALLIGAGLLLRTFASLHAVDVGLRTDRVLRFRVEAPYSRYSELSEMRGFFHSLEERLAALPDVESVGSMFGAPLGGRHATGDIRVRGRREPAPSDEMEAYIRSVSPELIETLGIPLLAGRGLTAADNREDAEPVALINRELADRVFPGEDPLGRQVRVAVDFGWGGSVYRRVVGVVGNVRFDGLTVDPSSDFYVPQGQFGPEYMTVHVRTASAEPTSLVPAVRAVVHDLDPDIPIYRVETLEGAVARQVAPARLYVVLLGAFAAAAALLAAVGLYGVVSFLVARRVREIGIRVALGADRSGVVLLVFGQGMRPAALGMILGLAGAFAAAHVLESVLFRVSPRDPVVFAAATALLTAVTAAATAVPAIRASRRYPREVLRAE